MPLAALRGGGCLCIITAVEGASYRPLGAGMVVAGDGSRTGSLSSGCIDADVALHALEALRTGIGRTLRYGRGSEMFDLQLPCGGGLEVMLVPRPDANVLRRVTDRLEKRHPVLLVVTPEGRISDDPTMHGQHLTLHPKLRIMIFGTGPEPLALLTIARAAGQVAEVHERWSENLRIDDRTAIALFFHDHDRELPILQHALTSPALFIGAQGSTRAKASRRAALHEMGLAEERIADPFGLVHAKDPQTLAVGVLAQILGIAAFSQRSR